jgi:L-threonylcarbamoyladenylate synthase
VSTVLPAADPLDADVLEAVRKTLAEGFPVGLPTDTVYVLAVDPFVTGASERLFTAKRRPRDVDLPVLVATLQQALRLVTALPLPARRLMERCWPGPLTLVLPRNPELAADLGDDEVTVGVRMSGHPVLLTICGVVGPLAVATAGIQGERELETAEEVAETFGDAVPLVLDGGRCAGLPATVIDATGEDPHLIREGRLPWADVLAVIDG